jgi:hypothetical protein
MKKRDAASGSFWCWSGAEWPQLLFYQIPGIRPRKEHLYVPVLSHLVLEKVLHQQVMDMKKYGVEI